MKTNLKLIPLMLALLGNAEGAETNTVKSAVGEGLDPTTLQTGARTVTLPDAALVGEIAQAPRVKVGGQGWQVSAAELERMEILRSVARESRGISESAHAQLMEQMNQQLAAVEVLLAEDEPKARATAREKPVQVELKQLRQALKRMEERIDALERELESPER